MNAECLFSVKLNVKVCWKKNKNKSTLNRSTEYYHQSTFEVAKDARCVKLVKEKKKHFDEWEL